MSPNQHLIKLYNIGNSCYLNASLQCLLNNQIFIDHLKSMTTRGKSVANLSRFTLLNTLLDLSKDEKPSSPVSLKYILANYSDLFKNNRQQDCAECLTTILDILHNETSELPTRSFVNYNSNDLSLINKFNQSIKEHIQKLGYSFIDYIFSGSLISQTRCLECLLENTTFQVFNSLTLDIPQLINKQYILERILNYIPYKKSVSVIKGYLESINYDILKITELFKELNNQYGPEPPFNEVSNEVSNESSKHQIPDIKDCLYDYIKDILTHDVFCDNCHKKTSKQKSTNIWSYPKVLTLVLNRYQNDGLRNNALVEINYTLNFDNKYRYLLKTIVNHQGSSQFSGHYTVNVIINDQEIYIIDDEQVSKTSFLKYSKDVYILVYCLSEDC